MIGVDHRGVAERINKLIPDYMLMGERGMADMGEMEMPLPGQHAADDDRQRAVRRDRDGRHVHRREGARGPGAQRLQGSGLVPAPAGTVAYEWKGEAPRVERRAGAKPEGRNSKLANRPAMPAIDR